MFGHFEKPLFLELCKHMEAKNVPAGGSLFKIGDEDNCIYVVQSGKMNVYITEGVGQQISISVISFYFFSKYKA